MVVGVITELRCEDPYYKCSRVIVSSSIKKIEKIEAPSKDFVLIDKSVEKPENWEDTYKFKTYVCIECLLAGDNINYKKAVGIIPEKLRIIIRYARIRHLTVLAQVDVLKRICIGYNKRIIYTYYRFKKIIIVLNNNPYIRLECDERECHIVSGVIPILASGGVTVEYIDPETLEPEEDEIPVQTEMFEDEEYEAYYKPVDKVTSRDIGILVKNIKRAVKELHEE